MGKMCGEEGKLESRQSAVDGSIEPSMMRVSYFTLQGLLQKPMKNLARTLPTA